MPRPPLRLLRWQYNGVKYIDVACGPCYLVFDTSLLKPAVEQRFKIIGAHLVEDWVQISNPTGQGVEVY